MLFHALAFHGEDGLDAVEGVALHPVGTADEVMRITGIFEAVDAAVLEETSDDAAHRDVFAHAGESGAQGADAAHEEVDFDPGARGAVEGLDDFFLHKGVELGENRGRSAGAGVFDFAVDEAKDVLVQVPGGDEETVGRGQMGDAGHGVEEVGHVFGDFGARGEEAQVGVEFGRGRMVVPCAEMDVAADAVEFFAHHHGHLGVGFQPGHTVDHVDAGFAQLAGPLDVGRLVEARFELDGHHDLFALTRGLHKQGDER